MQAIIFQGYHGVGKRRMGLGQIKMHSLMFLPRFSQFLKNFKTFFPRCCNFYDFSEL